MKVPMNCLDLEEPQKRAPRPTIWVARPSEDEVHRISFVDLDEHGELMFTLEHGTPFAFTRIVRWKSPTVPDAEHWRIPLTLFRQLCELNSEYPLGQHDLLLRVREERGPQRWPSHRLYETIAAEDRWYTNPSIHPDDRKFLQEPKKWPFSLFLPDGGPPSQWDWATCGAVMRRSTRGFESGTLVQIWDCKGDRKTEQREVRYLVRPLPVPPTYFFAPCNPPAMQLNPRYWLYEHPETTRVTVEEMLHAGWRVD